MKLLIADDHTLFRDALVQYIERANKDADVTVTKDFDEAYKIVKKKQDFDLILLDLRMPGMDGMKGFQTMREEYPDVKLALMSGVAEPEDVGLAMDLGASGYFPKTLSGKALIKGIQDVLNGEIYIPQDESLETTMPSYYADPPEIDRSVSGAPSDNNEAHSKDSISKALTPRESDVLEYLAQGLSNKEIANALGLQLVTVKLHVRGICRKLDANNRTQAALKAMQLGLTNQKQIALS